MCISSYYTIPADSPHIVSISELANYYRKTVLEKCLKEVYRLDSNSADLIIQKLSPLFTSQSLIDGFLSLSNNVNLIHPSEQKLSALGEMDAVIQAPQFHQILFENDSLRILDASIQPGEAVPFHTHQWDSIMIILQGSKFRIQDKAGSITEGEWGPSVEKFDGSFISDSYTNIGPQEFRAIAFEIKK